MKSPVRFRSLFVLPFVLCTLGASGQLAEHRCAQTAITVGETAGVANIELTRSGNLSQTTTGYISSPWSANEPLSGTYSISFAPGETNKTLTVPIRDNGYYSSIPQRANVICGGTGPGVSSSTSIIVVNVTEDEPFPTLVAPSSVQFTETDAAQIVTIPISFTPEFRRPSLHIWVESGTAKENDVEIVTYTGDFIQLRIFGDDVPENDETATLHIAGDAVKDIPITILDDDRPAFPYAFSPAEGYVFHEGDVPTVSVVRTGSVEQGAVLTLRVKWKNGGVLTYQPLVFAPGESNANSELPSFEDDVYTGAREGTLELELAGWIGAQTTFLILEDEARPSVSITDAALPEGNLGDRNHLELPVTLSVPLGTPFAINVTAAPGTANGDDVFLAPQTVVILPGEITGKAVFEIFGDINPEADETFHVTLGTCCDGVVTMGRRTATATIVNDDLPPTETVYRLALPKTAFRESGMWLTASVQRFGRLDAAALVTVHVTSSDARTFVPRRVWFAPNETEREVRFYIADDVYSGDADVRIDLADGSGVLQTANARIIETNSRPSIMLTGGGAREGIDKFVRYTVSVSPRSAAPISLHVSVRPETATYGYDLPHFDANIDIPALTSFVQFDVPINDDTDPEPTETFRLNVTNVTGASVFAAFGAAILDDDSVYTTTSALWAGGTATITVHLPAPAPADTSLRFECSPTILDGPTTIPVPKDARSVTFTARVGHKGQATFYITAPSYLGSTRTPQLFEVSEFLPASFEESSVTLPPGSTRVVGVTPELYYLRIETSDPGVAQAAMEWTGSKYAVVVYGVSPGHAEIRTTFGEATAILTVVVADPRDSSSQKRSVRH